MAYATDFEGADLRNVDFTNALLMESTFTNAVIDGADFTNVLIANDVKNKLCNIADGVNSVTNKKTSETLDCY